MNHKIVLGVRTCSHRLCPLPVFTKLRRIEAGPCPLHDYLHRRERRKRIERGSVCDECGTRIEYNFNWCEACCDENGHEYDFDEGGMCLACGNGDGYEHAMGHAEHMRDVLEDR